MKNLRTLTLALLAFLAQPLLAQCNPATSCCSRAPVGNPCQSSSSPAGGISQGVSNPIDVVSGNKYQRETDMPALPGVLGLEVVRHYNSHWAALEHKRASAGVLGAGWRLGYDTRLQRNAKGLTIYQADGAQLAFIEQVKTGSFEGERPEWGRVLPRADGYDWVWAKQTRTLRFNSAGALVRITANGGEYLILTYLPNGALEAVTDPQGRRMELQYQRIAGLANRLVRISTPAGALQLEYYRAGTTAGQLIGVRTASSERSYHYEDGRFPVFLTGVSVGKERMTQYAYSVQGHAVETQASGTAGKVQLTWPDSDLAKVSAVQGRGATYQLRTIAGVKRITAIDGPLRERMDYDAQGRLVKHEQGGVVKRYTYTGSPFVAEELVMPSNFAGKKRTWTVSRNSSGQVVSVVQRGYTNAAEMLELETHFRYETINQRQVLVEVTGPSKGQFTRYEWDALANFVIGVQSSIGVQAKLVYDDLGRVISRTVSDGMHAAEQRYQYPNNLMALTQAEQVSEFAFVPFGNPRINEISRVLQVARYDALGRKLASGPAPERMTRASYSVAGQLQSLTTPEGEQLRWHYDAYGQVLAQVHADASGEIKDGVMSLRDEQGVLRAVLRHQGEGLAYVYLREGQQPPSRVPPQANPNIDDFGRRLREHYKEDGEVRYHYQTNGWVQSRLAPDGKSTRQERLEFDQGGRLVLREREACTDRLSYKGTFLIAVSGCAATHTFNRNAIGQITEHSLELNVNKQALKFTQTFRYDSNGNLAVRTLLDGRKLHYAYGADGKTSQVSLDDLRAWRNTPRPLVEAITRAPHWLGASALTSWQDGAGKKVTWSAAPAPNSASEPVPASVSRAVSFDAWGRQTLHVPATGPNANRTLALTWDADNRLTQVAVLSTGALVARYSYDSFGNRISKTTPAATTIYIYDTRHRLIAEADANRKISRQYVYADHRVHTVLEGEQVRFMRTDWRGLPTSPDLPLRMAGQVLDEETGLYYNIHRYLDPHRWRYLSPDPLGAPDGVDRYAYLNGNPKGGIDPLGLFKVEYLGFSDPVHQEIVRDAFKAYNVMTFKSNHFSSAIIERFVNANLLTDLSDTQFDGRNHFDNPNDTLSGYNESRPGNYWIQQSIDLVNDRRQLYDDFQYVSSPGAGGLLRCKLDISEAVRSFGMNTHTLQDFYAHTNWVDPVTRGGEWQQNSAIYTGLDQIGRPTWALAIKEQGKVPIGLARETIWNESVTADIFSGNAQGCSDFACVGLNVYRPSTVYGHNVEYGTDEAATSAYYVYKLGNKVVNADKTTHAYWAKDSPEKGAALFAAARKLAVDHTVEEIKRLYNGASLELRAAFTMNDQQLRSNYVIRADVQLPNFPAR